MSSSGSDGSNFSGSAVMRGNDCTPVCCSPVLATQDVATSWASEASPTLGCSIEILRDIYMSVCMYVCLSYVKLIA